MRSEGKIIMGYLPIEAHHHDAILSLVQPAHPGYKIIDPFAGNGEFLEAAARKWNLTAYANELDQARAEKCIERFGPKQAVRGDAMRLRATNNAFAIGWINPPYDHDRAAEGNKRVEFTMLRHSWKWIQAGGLVMWCVYIQHITEDAMAFFAQYAEDADLWALPGKHQGEYDQVVLVATVGPGKSAHEMQTYNKLVNQKQDPLELTVQDEPLYK
jgi:16S rRNA G966 N2-methylase RsmD